MSLDSSGTQSETISGLQSCDAWPLNDHPLVHRLCCTCRNNSSHPSLDDFPELPQDEASLQRYILKNARIANCRSSGTLVEGKKRVAEIFAWTGVHGGAIGRRAVAGFIKGSRINVFGTYIHFNRKLSNPAKAAQNGVWLDLNANFFTGAIDHIGAATIVHEMEHYYWDAKHTGKTFGELRAYLAGYLYLREVGHTDDQIQTLLGLGDPTWIIGNWFCFKETSEPEAGLIFSKWGMDALRPQVGGKKSAEESRLPDYRTSS
jgi:hypothetical protein